jgi:tetratricopeptide (TPR) repeat protein
MRRLAWLLLLAPAAAAGDPLDAYYAKIAEAVGRVRDPALAPGVGIDRAYAGLAEAAGMQPDRWEAFLERGHNRCLAVFFMRETLREYLLVARARGADAAMLARTMEVGRRTIEDTLRFAHLDFGNMERRMNRLGEPHPEEVAFAGACMKWAAGEYLEAKRGAPGAIEDFARLVRAGYRVAECRERMAQCYVALADAALARDDPDGAQAHWDTALELTRDPWTMQVILTNKASGLEHDRRYDEAERILEELIRIQPAHPAHPKNLGLVLGYRGKLKEALHYYAMARERAAALDPRVGRFHGNAWLRPATIHGKLLDEDGDMRTAWRLFLAYRATFGDDYNFCFAFGDFLQTHGRYEEAVVFLERARDLLPRCPQPYELLLQIAPRTHGTREEVRALIARYKEQRDAARDAFDVRREARAVERACDGLRDLGDPGGGGGAVARIAPDPLAGAGPEDPPAWVREAAARRKPFVAWSPPDGAPYNPK